MDSAEASQIAAAAAREARRGPGPLADLLVGLDVGGDANVVALYTGRKAGRQSVAKYLGKAAPAPRDSHFTYGPARLFMTYHTIPIPTTTRVPRDV